MLEKHIQNSIIEYLTLKRYFFWRNNSGAFKTDAGGFYRFGEKGSPDICLIKNGKFIGLEVKNEKGKQSLFQKQWETDCKLAGGEYHVVKSIDDCIKIGL